ncbi:2Fe-2S iron-sulfur cluster binding domain-containing protein [Mesorhizobium sp. B3-1-3]|uniref:NADH:ubiquinone reductase (Na(+)-transporting) subunit F n=1 Tax=unclassified Mesorhizobium TaxID=325217 RepID=UPI00112B7AC4|nr:MULTISPECIES: 2Fe-2S iron-sulfur cluster binding domain-containing protein [unclassified Mesorhizobium]TPI69522.1 2Fe-2S iron-sulfur cluster binding domain-containing protein [Mesorhizobium sp. B3-1-8]TPI73807.1 2Fe-2S iron-sulfur cluster binding domain-containing protein [Mesorhizobium sp. B3-1-3]
MTGAHTVRLEPVGVEFEVEHGETVLNAAFRQGIALPHGCKEGQCSACKCVLLEGEVDMLKYSTFALNDTEKESGHVLLCRSIAYSDMQVELLNYDEEVLAKSIAVKTFKGRISKFEHLTHDIRGIEIELGSPIKFWAGQYVDITVTTQKGETITRSFSMANTPDETQKLSFIIKKYPEGKFSGELDSGGIRVGAEVSVAGPYGTCFRREGRQGPLILVGAGSGMSPVWSILNDHLKSGEKRDVYFFYGARIPTDLFYLDRIAELAGRHPELNFIPVLSHVNGEAWDGERGFVHQGVDAKLKQLAVDGQGDVYACGPPPMIDALQPVLFMNGFETERIFFDRFTTSSNAVPAH